MNCFLFGCMVPLRKKLVYHTRSHICPFTRSMPIRFILNARAQMCTFSLVRHSTGCGQ